MIAMKKNIIVIGFVVLYFIYNVSSAVKTLKEDKNNNVSNRTTTVNFVKNILLALFDSLDLKLWF